MRRLGREEHLRDRKEIRVNTLAISVWTWIPRARLVIVWLFLQLISLVAEVIGPGISNRGNTDQSDLHGGVWL